MTSIRSLSPNLVIGRKRGLAVPAAQLARQSARRDGAGNGVRIDYSGPALQLVARPARGLLRASGKADRTKNATVSPRTLQKYPAVFLRFTFSLPPPESHKATALQRRQRLQATARETGPDC